MSKKKTEIEQIVNEMKGDDKPKLEPGKNAVDDIEIHHVDLPPEPESKRKKPKKKTRGKSNGKKRTVEKKSKQVRRTKNAGLPAEDRGKQGDKGKREREGILDRLLPPWF